MSGLQIFNAYPRLHWGHEGHEGMPAVFEIGGVPDLKRQDSWVQIGAHRFNTSGVLGVAKDAPFLGVANMAFPPWMTLPPGLIALGTGMGWHFMMLWVLIFNLTMYLLYVLINGRLWKELLPDRDQLRPSAIARDLWMHILLRHSTGIAALRYNLLQKLSYLIVLLGLLPTMILTGLTMSPSAVAAFPWLIDLFHGRQTARTLHFIVAWTLVLFVIVHLFQVIITGFFNNLRSITGGYFVIQGDDA
jgi:thiosulfate reductase cytochrome b subunit